jgi:hypothetical protein
MIPADKKRQIETLTAQVVADMKRRGRSDEMIRTNAVKVAAAVIAQEVGDAWQQESYVAEVYRGIEKALRRTGHASN